jgi:glutamate 5-kinase
MIGADLLVLFSDVDGLYTAPPGLDPDARHLPVVERITPAIEAMAGGAGSELSRGGMRTKIEAGRSRLRAARTWSSPMAAVKTRCAPSPGARAAPGS